MVRSPYSSNLGTPPPGHFSNVLTCPQGKNKFVTFALEYFVCVSRVTESVLFLKSKTSRSTIYEKCMFNEILSLVEYLITSSIQ